MKRYLLTLAVFAIGGVIGFSTGRATAPQPDVVYAGGVDCYDASGNLVHGWAEKYGGVSLTCAPGQTARPHQGKK